MVRRHLGPIVFGVLAIALVVVAFTASPDGAGSSMGMIGTMTAALAVVAGVAWHRPVRPVPWLIMALGLVVSGLAVWSWAGRGFVDDQFPGAGEAIAAMAYPSIFVGLIAATSAERGVRDLLSGAEPLIYAIAASSLVWLAVMEPFLDTDELPMERGVWIWIFAVLDLLLALVASRALAFRPGRPVFVILVVGFLTWSVAHAVTGWRRGDGVLEPERWETALLMAGPLLVGLAALMPSLAAAPPDPEARRSIRWAHVIGVTIAALVPLAALIMMLAIDAGDVSRSSILVVSGSTLAVVILAIARMWALVGAVRQLTEERGQSRLAAMIEHSNDIVVLCDADGVVGYVSPGVVTTLGIGPEVWAGHHLVDLVVAEEREGLGTGFGRLVEQGRGATIELEATLVRADGKQRRATVIMANLLDEPAIEGVVVTFRDITEQRNLERQLSHRAFHDELTGLANRALFLDRMDHALRITRSDNDPVVVLFVDLDDFKKVNDALGHAVGDQMLRAVADRIRRSAGTGDTAARLGGDEFAILLEDRGGVDRAIDVAERLLEELRHPVTIGGYDVTVLASVGVAVAAPGTSTTSVLRDADIAMYEAKRAGKGQIRIFDPAMRLMATRHLEYRSELGAALENGQFRLAFMPFVDLRSGEVRGAEALVRWHHPQYGDVAPSEFLPIAERSGLMVPIGHWVLEESLRQVATWRTDAG
ncbi:MAG: diguanylate cyclase, partial [Ilumatobacteraceae bacterium]|nr:diguanylate cyclase [Ilumatobacteraceae bacterium]